MEPQEFRSTKIAVLIFFLINFVLLLAGAFLVAASTYIWVTRPSNQLNYVLIGMTIMGGLTMIASLLGFFRRSIGCLITYLVVFSFELAAQITLLVLVLVGKLDGRALFVDFYDNALSQDARSLIYADRCTDASSCYDQSYLPVVLAVVGVVMVLEFFGLIVGGLQLQSARKRSVAMALMAKRCESQMTMSNHFAPELQL